VIRKCTAFEVSELAGNREFSRAMEARETPPEVVYLWEDLAVTELPIPDAVPIFASADDAWRELCAGLLRAVG
jgi:hypothetical protein